MNPIKKIYYSIPIQIRAKTARFLERRWLYQKTVLRQNYFNHTTRSEEITIELTDRCNLKCAYCPKSLGVGGKGGDIEWDIFTSIIDHSSYKLYILTGYGEPTLYPKLIEAVTYIRAKHPDAKIGFNTNAAFLSYELGAKLVAAGLTNIRISINAVNAEQYERINNSKGYDRVVQNAIDFLHAINESGKNVEVGIQVFSGKINNKAQLQIFRDFWRPYLGKCGLIMEVTMSNMYGTIDIGAINRREAEARGEQYKNIPEMGTVDGNEPRKKDKNFYPCPALFAMHSISRQGNALLCCNTVSSEQNELYIGNITESSALEIYTSQKAKELMQRNLNCEIYRYSPCDKCSTWQTLSNVFWRNPFYPLFGTKWF